MLCSLSRDMLRIYMTENPTVTTPWSHAWILRGTTLSRRAPIFSERWWQAICDPSSKMQNYLRQNQTCRSAWFSEARSDFCGFLYLQAAIVWEHKLDMHRQLERSEGFRVSAPEEEGCCNPEFLAPLGNPRPLKPESDLQLRLSKRPRIYGPSLF